jgi:hypothetical protein
MMKTTDYTRSAVCTNKTSGDIAVFVRMINTPPESQKVGTGEPRNITSYDPNRQIWCSKGLNGWGHADAKYWEEIGWDLQPLYDAESKKPRTLRDLQDALIDYAYQKPSRLVHLKALRNSGVLNVDISYERAVKLITNYLDGNKDICESGALEAKKFLGIAPDTWVEKYMTVSDILSLNDEDVRITPPDSQWHKESTLDYKFYAKSTAVVRETLRDSMFGDTIIKVWVREKN